MTTPNWNTTVEARVVDVLINKPLPVTGETPIDPSQPINPFSFRGNDGVLIQSNDGQTIESNDAPRL